MKSVTVNTLKADLDTHIQLVQSGEEILVRVRNKPSFRLVPYSDEGYTEQEQRLIARGALIPPKNKHRVSLPRPTGRMISREVMDQVWREEREGR